MNTYNSISIQYDVDGNNSTKDVKIIIKSKHKLKKYSKTSFHLDNTKKMGCSYGRNTINS
jgi:hypothetical protein